MTVAAQEAHCCVANLCCARNTAGKFDGICFSSATPKGSYLAALVLPQHGHMMQPSLGKPSALKLHVSHCGSQVRLLA